MESGFVGWVVHLVQRWGYHGIFFATFLESTFVPIPSEFTMVPAGYLVYKGHMHLLPVMAASIFGTILGAVVNYYIARYLGRPVLMRFKKYFFLNDTKIYKIETFFARHGEISTLTGRLVPGLRHLISFPAGLARMDVSTFCIFTGIGGGIWMGALTLLGYLIGGNEVLVRRYMPKVALAGVMVAAAIVLGYIGYLRYVTAKDKEKNDAPR